MYEFKPRQKNFAKSPFNRQITDFNFKKVAVKKVNFSIKKNFLEYLCFKVDLLHKEFLKKSCPVFEWKLVIYNKKFATYTKYWHSYGERSSSFFGKLLFIQWERKTHFKFNKNSEAPKLFCSWLFIFIDDLRALNDGDKFGKCFQAICSHELVLKMEHQATNATF